MKALNVLIISDGKSGHMTQSLGLVNYLKKTFAVDDETLQIRPRIKVANPLLGKLLNKKSSRADLVFKLFYKFDTSQIRSNKPDLIISAGGNTCGVNALLAQKYKCTNLYFGSLRKHQPQLFSGVITTTEMPDVDNSIILDVVPTLIDTEKLQEAASIFLKAHSDVFADTTRNLWVMLIGGDGSGYNYSKEDYKDMVSGMITLAKKHKIRWLVTTSRRTGVENENYLQSLLQEQGQNEIAYAVYFNKKPEKIMQAYLGAGEIIYCTEDSTSMVSEAIISKKPVITLRGATKNINKGHKAVITRFAKNKHIKRIKMDELQGFSPKSIEFKAVNVEKGYDKIVKIINDFISAKEP